MKTENCHTCLLAADGDKLETLMFVKTPAGGRQQQASKYFTLELKDY